jgi:hypothetical protein
MITWWLYEILARCETKANGSSEFVQLQTIKYSYISLQGVLCVKCSINDMVVSQNLHSSLCLITIANKSLHTQEIWYVNKH